MSTPGSVFLVLQALYPYLLRAGAVASVNGTIRVDITGGTNVSFSPSMSYIRQVLVPNLRRLGLPGLEVELRERGWGMGKQALGSVSVFVQPLASKPDKTGGYAFPKIDLDKFRRGKVKRIDIIVLAPDDVISRDGEDIMVRGFIESETIRELGRRLPNLPSSIFQSNPDKNVPIQAHTSERTHHRTHFYILITAHTTTNFILSRDILLAGEKATSSQPKNRHHHHKTNSKKTNRSSELFHIQTLVHRCVDRFLMELYSPHLEGSDTWQTDGGNKHQPCVDEYMRDQLIIFGALGRCSGALGDVNGESSGSIEDERYWSLHTQTARWVCGEVLDVKW